MEVFRGHSFSPAAVGISIRGQGLGLGAAQEGGEGALGLDRRGAWRRRVLDREDDVAVGRAELDTVGPELGGSPTRRRAAQQHWPPRPDPAVSADMSCQPEHRGHEAHREMTKGQPQSVTFSHPTVWPHNVKIIRRHEQRRGTAESPKTPPSPQTTRMQ